MTDPKTQEEESTEQSSGWWGSWISSAKTKSAEVYSMVKKDLDEISNAVKSEASQVYSATSSVLEKTLKLDEPQSTANVMKKSFSTFLDQVNTVLNPQPDDEDTEVILSTGDTTMLATYKRELEALQRLDATFLVPADSAEFSAWKSTAEGAELTPSPAAAERRLRSEPLLAEQYEKLVPGAIEQHTFWERYLFRVALLQDRLAAAVRHGGTAGILPVITDPVLSNLPLQTETQSETRSADGTPLSSQKSSPLRSPSKSTSLAVEPSLSEDLDEGVAWEEEDFADDVELTEEQQTLLLQEYEKEIATKKLLKTTTTSKDQANNNKNQSPSKQNNITGKQNSKQRADKLSAPKQSNTKNIKDGDNKVKQLKNENIAASKSKATKSDVCGNNLIEDHFKEETKAKDDASSNSDESWEKEFEIEDS